MASIVWLLVKWLNESDELPEYGVHYVRTSDFDKEDLQPETTISFSVDNERPRLAKILRISDNKSYIVKQRQMQEHEDKQINEFLNVSMPSVWEETVKEIVGKIQRSHGSRHTNKNTRTTDTVDQETQTEDIELAPNVCPLMKNLIENLANFIKKWDQTNLNSQHHKEESYVEQNVSESCLEPNNTVYDQEGDFLPAEIADVGAEEVIEASVENQTLSSSYRETEENLYPNDPRVRTTHTTHDDDDKDLVPIGIGKTLVSRRLLQELDRKTYTTTTRQLLQGIFPRNVLATSCLTGKKSPAFLNKPAKKILDPVKVNDIVTTVSTMCNVPRNLVRSCITIKCTDEAKLHRKRQQDRLTRISLHQNNENNPPISPLSNEIVTPDEAHINRQQGTCRRISLQQNEEATPSSHETVATYETNRNRKQGMRPRMFLNQHDENIPPSKPSSNETVAPQKLNLNSNRQQGKRQRMSLDQNVEDIPPTMPSSAVTVAPHEANLLRNGQQGKRPRMSLHQNDENIPPTTLSNEAVGLHEAKLISHRQQGKRPRMSLHQSDENIPPTTLSNEAVAPHEAKLISHRQQGKRPRMSLHQSDENIPPAPSSYKTIIPNKTSYQNDENIPPLTPPSDDTLANMN